VAITTAAPEDVIASALWNSVAGLINGTATFGNPVILTQLSSGSAWALTVRNQGSGGQALRVQNAAGTDLVTIADTGLSAAFAVGSVTAPGFVFIGDPNTGIYWPAADQVAITAGGVQKGLFDVNGLTVTGNVTAVSRLVAPVGAAADPSVRVGNINIGLYATGSGGLGLVAGGASRQVLEANGDIVPGTGVLATTATFGWTWLMGTAGTPTGVPATTATGRYPMVYDSSANKIWVYNGSWRGVAVT
jgi:hypothetical protein